MKKLIFVLIFGSLFAQYLPDVSEMSEIEKMLVFENNKKSPAISILFIWIVKALFLEKRKLTIFKAKLTQI